MMKLTTGPLFIFSIDVSPSTLEYFNYMVIVSIMMGENQAVPKGST